MEGATTMDGALGAKNGANSGVAINLTLFLCAYYIALLAPHICDAKTMHRHVSPWCGDGVGVLGLGAA